MGKKISRNIVEHFGNTKSAGGLDRDRCSRAKSRAERASLPEKSVFWAKSDGPGGQTLLLRHKMDAAILVNTPAAPADLQASEDSPLLSDTQQ